MRKNKYNNFVKHFDTIRDVVRNFYLYGCYSRDDFDAKKISGRKYDNERRRIINYIKNEYVKETISGHTKYISLNYDMFKCTENYLSNLFFTKSFKWSDVVIYFYILQILHKDNIARTTEEIFYEIMSNVPDEADDFKNFHLDTLRRKLKQMNEEGLLQVNTKKNKKLFSVSEDFFSGFSDEEIITLFEAVLFFSNVSVISVPGFYLLETLKNYMKYERHKDIEQPDIFMFKHTHLQSILDDEINYTIINCMDKNCMVSFKYREKDTFNVVKPLKIIVDLQYGRLFLLAFDIILRRLSIFRLDKIYDISQEKKSEVEGVFLSDFDKYLEKSWCATLLNEEKGLVKVEVEILIDECKEGYIIDRFKREGKCGSLKRIDKGMYLYKIAVTDSNELIPWLRTFAGYIRVKESREHNIEEKLEKDWEESLKKYGVI